MNWLRTQYHCTGSFDNEELQALLIEQNIKIKEINDKKFVFDIFSDNFRLDDILNALEKENNKTILKWVVFSEKEMYDAQWYSMGATMLAIDTKKRDFTYTTSCPYQRSTRIAYRHIEQVKPFVANRTPKWKNRYNFCGVETGDYYTVFCSDEARRVLSENKIVGIEYIPVLTGDMITEKENIQQLTFPNVLPMAAIDFIGSYKENICPTCGRKSYEFLEPNMDNWHIVPSAIPKGIDAFITEVTFDPGQYREIVISKKLYNVLIEQMKEKHLDCRPVG